MTDPLFEPIKMGDYTLKNRVFMAPMTRGRADAEGAPTDIVAQYYQQRASAGLIITEAVAVNRRGHGWPGAPGNYTDHHQAGWKKVADAVHAEGGRIFMQIWHMGWAVIGDYIDGQLPIAPSAIAAQGEIPNKQGVPTKFEVALEMTKADIEEVKTAFVDSAKRAVAAGIDGVEIHAANSFVIDAFLRDGTNKRTDEYGGSLENRARFLLEVTDAIVAAIGAGKVCVRFSPTNGVFGITDSNPEETFGYAARELAKRNLAYLHVLEPPISDGSFMSSDLPRVAGALRQAYDGFYILNGSLTQETGRAALQSGAADAVAFGAPYVANPDLVERFQNGIALAEPDADTFYTPGPEGFITYPKAELEPV